MTELLANIGDINFLEYGGTLLFRSEDPDLEYSETWGEIVEPPEDTDTDKGPWRVWRFDIEQLRRVEDDGKVYLVHSGWDPGDPPSLYAEWVSKHVESTADALGCDVEELRSAFCSDNPVDRLFAWSETGRIHGLDNLDGYPLKFSQHEVYSRYGQLDDCCCLRCQLEQREAEAEAIDAEILARGVF